VSSLVHADAWSHSPTKSVTVESPFLDAIASILQNGSMLVAFRPLVLLLACSVACGCSSADDDQGTASDADGEATVTPDSTDGSTAGDGSAHATGTDDTGAEPSTTSTDGGSDTTAEDDTSRSTTESEDDDENQLAWVLDGVEIARASGAEADSTYLFLPYFGRNVQATWTSPPAPGTYDCADIIAGTMQIALITSDNGWANLDDLPAQWDNLNINTCNAAGTIPDTVEMTLTLTTTQGRYTGSYWAQIVGAGPRAGETLVLDGTFDVAYP
jgi:hypothetical protein